jgi:hypothetical protein
MLVLVAFKILIKSGRDLQRAFDIDPTMSIFIMIRAATIDFWQARQA